MAGKRRSDLRIITYDFSQDFLTGKIILHLEAEPSKELSGYHRVKVLESMSVIELLRFVSAQSK